MNRAAFHVITEATVEVVEVHASVVYPEWWDRRNRCCRHRRRQWWGL